MAKTKTYKTKLRDPRWQKKRLLILQRDNWACILCGDTKNTLHVHHKKYSGQPWEAKDDELMTLCEECHFLTELNKPNQVYKIIKEPGKGKIFFSVFTEFENNMVVSLYIKVDNAFSHIAMIKEEKILRYTETFERIHEDKEINLFV